MTSCLLAPTEGTATALRWLAQPTSLCCLTLLILGSQLLSCCAWFVVQVCGEATYVDDMKMHNMLHAALVVSSRPHAKIISIDASGAVLVCYMSALACTVVAHALQWVLHGP